MRKFNKKLTRARVRPTAMDYGLFLVSLRAQTSSQLKEKLERKGYPKDEITVVINRLTELKYLDDQQFAQIFFDNLIKYKHFGYYGIKRKLMQKKIEPKVVEGLLKGLTVAEEKEIAKRALGAKPVEKERLVRMLQSRGFRSEVIMKMAKTKREDFEEN